ncbi:MAG TPA: 50S ribosomal protein L24 [Phycisphaerae bacterium]|jgi:large subunit ribosomal protein L24|nr:50S ribosomal protein L24 [Phycisphaerae bacterium]HOB75754.1 50S ribosomal protein L24 [Phycisphaerae bacterium]HOJ55614.1 50S ribosomal protein L24 [Phycisphaerae bacterium]HOL27690.1 50S ribosomal protein L24 [Phycisphaerae bacterium]HPP21928.1 50S ribosomal protein L24 [Phycisphaerae bacterium]
MAVHIRKDDMVEVIAGEHKGERGKVLKVMPKDGLVLVQGVNMVYRHVRPSRRNPQGGRLQKEAPVHISNVLPIDERAGRGKRVRFEVEQGEDGRRRAKYRVTVAGTRLNEVTREKAEG